MDIVIVRETNKYNKSMKYHLIEFDNSGGKVGGWYKTKKEAEYEKTRRENHDPNKYTRVL